MRPIRPSDNAIAPPKSVARRGRWVWLSGAVVVLALGGWLVARERAREAERAAALAAGYNQSPEAGERLRACLARDPDDIEVLETLVVWSLRGKVPFSQFEPQLDRLCELERADPTPWRNRARERIRAGRVEEGIADGFRALELSPRDSETLELVANTALETGDPALAVQALGKLNSYPAPPDDLTELLVRAHLQSGDVGEAEQAVARFFPATRSDARSQLLRGLVCQAAGRHAEAIPLLRSAGRSSEFRSNALFSLSKSLSALGRQEEARQALEELDAAQARERAVIDAGQRPKDLNAQVRAAEALLSDGKPMEAVDLLERAAAIHGRQPAAMAVLARAYRALGREDLARLCDQIKR
jgi:predicted Zn-dependent protease